MKILIYILLTLLIFYILYAYKHTQNLVQIGTAVATNTTPYTQVGSSGKQFLVIGDSTAVGVGATNPSESIAGRIGQDYPTVSIKNLGVSGAKTNEIVPTLVALKDESFDFILIQIGGNDIVRFTNLSELKNSINNVIIEAKKHSDTVILMTSGNVGTAKLLPIGTRFLFTKRTEAVRETFMSSSKINGVEYVDLYRATKDDPFAKDPEIFYAKDSFHPSSKGYADWYTFLKRTMDTISFQ